MTLPECLMRMRELVTDGEHRLGGMLMVPSLLEDSARGDRELAIQALEILDGCTPRPWTFSVWVDGPRWVNDSDSFAFVVYSYDRKPAEILAVIGKALMRANALHPHQAEERT